MKRAFQLALGILLVVASQGVAAQTATVMTDQADYAPGTIVTITGTGWQPGETVTLSFVELPLIDTHPDLYATADANGNIFNNQFSPDQHDVNITFTLTATGQTSGLTAQTVFTDSISTVACSPNPVTVNNNTTCTVTGSGNSENGNTITWSVTSGGTGTFPSGNTCVVSGGTCSVTYKPTSAPNGTQNIHASSSSGKTGDATLTANRVTPTVAITSEVPASPSVVGQPVTVNVSVTGVGGVQPNPTGTVTISDGTGDSCTTPNLTVGSPSMGNCAITITSSGSKTLTATYNGDGVYTTALGTGSYTVNKANTTTALASSQNPSSFGQSITFTATMTVSAPGSGSMGGTVAFWDAGSGATCASLGASTQIGTTQNVSSNTASVSTASLAVGSHTILACYGGDVNFNGSSGSVSQTVNASAARRGQTIVAGLFRDQHVAFAFKNRHTHEKD